MVYARLVVVAERGRERGKREGRKNNLAQGRPPNGVQNFKRFQKV